MKKRKICVVINNRANYARIKSVLIEIKKNKKLELQIVLGSSAILQRYGEVSDIIKRDGFKINRSIYNINRKIVLKFNSQSKDINGVFLGLGDNGSLKIKVDNEFLEYYSVDSFFFPDEELL